MTGAHDHAQKNGMRRAAVDLLHASFQHASSSLGGNKKAETCSVKIDGGAGEDEEADEAQSGWGGILSSADSSGGVSAAPPPLSAPQPCLHLLP